MVFIKTDRANASLYVEDTRVGKPIIFIHGWPLSSKMFEYQFMHLAHLGYRCIGIDLMGFGMSDRPWGDHHYNYDVYADDIRHVISHLDVKDAALVGFSMGGAIAMHYLAKYRGWGIDKAVLMGAAAPSFTKREGYPYGKERSEVDAMIAGSLVDRPKLNADFGKIVFKDEEGSVSKEMAAWVHSIGLEAAPHAVLKCVEQLRDSDLRKDMETVDKLNLPVAIFHGTHDKVCGFELAKVMKAGISNSKLVEFTRSGHALNIEEIQKTNEELIKFIP